MELLEILSKREDLKYASDIAPVRQDEMKEKLGNRVYFTPKENGCSDQRSECKCRSCSYYSRSENSLKMGIQLFR